MISIGRLGLGHAEYYLTEVVDGREDYFVVSAEVPGRWSGKLADRLGLGGIVDQADLRLIFEGVQPGTDTRLRANQVSRVAFDFTLSVPKSVSLMWALGDDHMATEVVAAVETANRVAIDFLEREACGVRRGHAGIDHLAGAGFVVASFRHGTSRAGDPQLHVHNLIANLGLGPDGRFTAIDSELVYRWSFATSHVFECVLRAELAARLGTLFTPIEKGTCDVAGIPADVRRAFSQRRAEIVDYMEERGMTSRRAAEFANLQTRKTKDRERGEPALRAEWRERVEGLGFDMSTLMLIPRPVVLDVDDATVAAFLTDSDATFARQDAYVAVARLAGEGADLAQIDERVESFLAGPAAVALRPGELWTTPEILTVEQRSVAIAAAGLGCGAGVASSVEVERAIAARPSLSDEQATMVRAICESGNRYDTVIGRAGAGKTFTLDGARDAWEASGYRLLGTAPSARAAQELRAGATIDSRSADRLLTALAHGRERMDERTIVVLDEGGMLGTRRLAALLDYVEQGNGKLVAIGDPKQLPEIDAGGLFAGIARRNGYVELTENRRQLDPDEREALAALRAGRVADAVGHMDRNGQPVTAPNADQIRDALAGDWHELRRSGSDAVMMARRRQDTADLNMRARQLLVADGELTQTVMVVDDLEFAIGDRVVAHKNRYDLGILNAERATVVGTRGDRLLLDVDGGERQVAIPTDYIADGHLTHGCASTIHKNQGTTCDAALVLGDDAMFAELGYSALTRGRDLNRLYLVRTEREHDHGLDLDGPDPIEALVASLQRSHAKTAAIDHPTVQPPTEGISL
jgi:conjugative relaxase-like TrwC/TraI family protein